MSNGIFGIVNFDRNNGASIHSLVRMGDVLRNTGEPPPSPACYCQENIGLGMIRPNGHSHNQTVAPARNERDDICAVFSGEMHNYRQLKSTLSPKHIIRETSDVEIVPHLYEEYGKTFPRQINGLFSIALWDRRRCRFILTRDRFGGVQPLFWTKLDDCLVFGSHIKSLLQIAGVKREINAKSLKLFLKYSYISAPDTIFEGISKLPPGKTLFWERDKIRIEDCWSFNTYGQTLNDPESCAEQYRKLLSNSIERRLGPQERVGLLLSGGLDSSANVAITAQLRENRLRTFSVGFEDSQFDERPFARIISRRYGTEHHEIALNGTEIEQLPRLIWHLEEPFFEDGLFLNFAISELAKDHVDIILGGEGVDQLFGTGGGSQSLFPIFWRAVLDRLNCLGIFRSVLPLMNHSFFLQDNGYNKIRVLCKRIADFNDWYFWGFDACELVDLISNGSGTDLPIKFDNSPILPDKSLSALYHYALVNLDIGDSLSENILVKSGRMADLAGLTIREPFLDTDLADFVISLNIKLKRKGSYADYMMGKSVGKYLHRASLKDLLPEEVLLKPKQGGFVPTSIFLRDERLRRKIFRHLLNSDIMREHFDLCCIRRILAGYEALQAKGNYWPKYLQTKANQILYLLTFDIWHRIYIQQSNLSDHRNVLAEYLDC